MSFPGLSARWSSVGVLLGALSALTRCDSTATTIPENDAEAGALNTGGTPNAGGAPGAAGASSEGGAGEAGASFVCDAVPERYGSAVVQYEFGPGQDFGQAEFPARVLGPPRGGGCCTGSLDVTSLGEGGFAVLEFGNNVIQNADGPDFLVFENAFVPASGGPETVFAEVASVSVSQDGERWFAFPCTATAYPFDSCAGWHPVLANSSDGELGPLSPETAGGDPFDLADVGLDWVRYVRIEDRVDVAGTFDLDAVGIVHSGCPSQP